MAKVIQTVASTCDIDSTTFDVHTDLGSLGVDSLLSIEIFGKLQGLFPHTRLDAQALIFCHTIAEIVEELCLKHGYDEGGMSSSSTLISNVSGDDPLIGDETNVNNIDKEAVLGFDSSKPIEALHALKHNFGHDLSFGLRDHTDTIPGCAAKAAKPLTRQIDPESIVKAFRLGDVPVPIQKSSAAGRFPLFLIHDGSGLISYYDRLSPLGRDVWGIHNPHFVNETPWPWDSLVSMATEYASYVLKVTSDPVLIGGKSYAFIFGVEVLIHSIFFRLVIRRCRCF